MRQKLRELRQKLRFFDRGLKNGSIAISTLDFRRCLSRGSLDGALEGTPVPVTGELRHLFDGVPSALERSDRKGGSVLARPLDESEADA